MRDFEVHRNSIGRATFFGVLGCLLVVELATMSMAQSNIVASRASFYVDCESRAKMADGHSSDEPWTSLGEVNSHTFVAGDTIRFKRGTTCNGTLWPTGSGSTALPIHLTAYGSGTRPKIAATSADRQAFLLDGQEYWDIDSLDISGGNTYGVFITGEKGVLHHIHLANMVVHDVKGGELKSKDSGLVVISPGTMDQHFDDVLVDGVTAYNTAQWAGILVGGGNFGYSPESTWSNRVVIRNSMIHDVQGDGIVMFRVRDGRISSSVAWNTGMQETQTIGTPNAIWTWMCHDCMVEGSEAFLTDSPGVDGGAFDVDYGNTNNSVIGNYGHDTQGYCVSVFGAGGVTHTSTVRGNVCLNNGRSPRMAQYQGAIFLLTWNNGVIDGVTVEDNTVYWNPPGTAPALINAAEFGESKAVFRNNVIYSTSPWMITSNRALTLEGNRYFLTASTKPQWNYDGESYETFSAYQTKTGQDRHGEFETSLRSPESPEWISTSAASDQDENALKSNEFKHWIGIDGRPIQESKLAKKWRIYCRLPGESDRAGLLNESSRRQLTILKSLALQYYAKGLEEVVLLETSPANSPFSTEIRNAINDLDTEQIIFASAPASGKNRTEVPQTLLVSPDDKIVARWRSFAGPAELGIAVWQRLGEPAYSQLGAQLQ
jgi:hypothetical protein